MTTSATRRQTIKPSYMKIYILNNENMSIDIIHAGNKFAVWCIDHNIGDEEYDDPEVFNEFVTDLLKSLGYDESVAEFAQYIRCDEGEEVTMRDVFPE